jgi:hypothetical protein
MILHAFYSVLLSEIMQHFRTQSKTGNRPRLEKMDGAFFWSRPIPVAEESHYEGRDGREQISLTHALPP